MAILPSNRASIEASRHLSRTAPPCRGRWSPSLPGSKPKGPAFLVIDMLEQGLDEPTQKALIARLRARGPEGRPLFFLTRSCAILDLSTVGADEGIILCPANHSPPMRVAPYPGAPGYDSVATCLASPEVRARTEGVIAWRPKVA